MLIINMSAIYVACIDAEPLGLQSGGPMKLGLSIVSLQNNNVNILNQESYELTLDNIKLITLILDVLHRQTDIDLRLVGDNVALMGAWLHSHFMQLEPPRAGPQYRLGAKNKLEWTPWLDIESLQLGYMHSTASYMYDRDEIAYPKNSHVEEALMQRLPGVPRPLEESEAADVALTSQRVAVMYAMQLRACLLRAPQNSV